MRTLLACGNATLTEPGKSLTRKSEAASSCLTLDASETGDPTLSTEESGVNGGVASPPPPIDFWVWGMSRGLENGTPRTEA